MGTNLTLASRDAASGTSLIEATDDRLSHPLEAQHVDHFVHKCGALRAGPIRGETRVGAVLDDLLNSKCAQHDVVLHGYSEIRE
jgi:hypothetical protein